MTDRALAEALLAIGALETAARAAVQGAGETAERAAAQDVARHTVPARLALERWILLRATRAALSS